MCQAPLAHIALYPLSICFSATRVAVNDRKPLAQFEYRCRRCMSEERRRRRSLDHAEDAPQIRWEISDGSVRSWRSSRAAGSRSRFGRMSERAQLGSRHGRFVGAVRGDARAVRSLFSGRPVGVLGAVVGVRLELRAPSLVRDLTRVRRRRPDGRRSCASTGKSTPSRSAPLRLVPLRTWCRRPAVKADDEVQRGSNPGGTERNGSVRIETHSGLRHRRLYTKTA
jgi:hypothetical protein